MKADTVTKNTSIAAISKLSVNGWSFATYNDSSDTKVHVTLCCVSMVITTSTVHVHVYMS